ncbi:SMI1/KNR4 family protein [Planobispora siamensis]|uniref:SMI1/KNR4 family protein n=1 Tax=Planobispora siamensis TaxID=936338 RepID=UPI00194DBBDE|nr:SMI1/KNR4 family protein [Planobispora siamensis]
MRRLISSRWVRLALAAAATAAVVVAVLRLRRLPAAPEVRKPPRAPLSPEGAAGSVAVSDAVPGRETPVGAGPADHTADRAQGRPAPEAPAARDEAVRRRVVRWGSVAIALCVLIFATQALERAVFSQGTAAEDVQPEHLRETPMSLEELCAQFGDRPIDRGTAELCEREWGTAAVYVGEAPDGLPGEEPPVPSVEDSSVGISTGATGEPTAAPSADSSGPAADEDCRPETATPAVREVDPRVSRAVNRQWRRIEQWLKANAPKTHRTLSPPARARTIAIAESQMGLRFPDDLRASLLRHNGSVFRKSSGLTIFLYDGMNVRDIRDAWRMLCGIDTDDYGDPRGDWWDGRMIPVGSDGLGNHLVVDSVRRDVGETDHEGVMDFEPGGIRIRSYYALLRMTADALEKGGTVGHWKPVVNGDTLSWEIVGN